MQSATIIVLAFLVAVVVAQEYNYQPALSEQEFLQDPVYDTPVHDRSPRTKRFLLLKKKLLLGALGLKAAKVGAVGVAGALALKSKSSVPKVVVHQGYSSYTPWNVQVHSWSG